MGYEDRARSEPEQTGKAVDTIVALSSGRLPAGVAIVRVSGPKSRFALETIAGEVPSARMAQFCRFVDAAGAPIDTGLALFFPGPNSFTGEDVAEFQIHGGRASVSALLNVLTSMDGVRHAEPGEYTQRAFLNGKLDLTETEALADLIAAETEAQRRFALANAAGAQRTLYLGWRERLLHARAMVEAEIDFADEDDVPGSVAASMWADVRALIEEIERHVAGFHAAEIIRDGYDVVILGAPNAGKSSLFNVLAKRDAAIVTDEPGTTRDLLEIALDLGGIRVRVTDTAGLREAGGRIESMGIERARARAAEADLVLMLEDLTAPAHVEVGVADRKVMKIGTKVDLVPGALSGDSRYDRLVSSTSGAGIPELLEEVGSRASAAVQSVGDVLPSRLRHIELLQTTMEFLAKAIEEMELELRAEDLRLAADTLGRIVGAVDVEDILGAIFSQFCIGK